MLRERLKNYLLKEIANGDFLAMLKKDALPFQRMMAFYKCAMMSVETKFNVLNEEFSLQYDRNPIETVKARLKSPEGIFQKMKRKGLEMSISSIEEHITDIAGVRVICSFPEDIFLLADCLLRQDDITLVERKDYIRTPKPSGYRSLHLIVEVPIFLAEEKRQVRVEVQLRTIAMDFWASLEHKLLYKKTIPQDEASWLRRELLECAQTSAQLDLRMQEIRSRINKYEDCD